LARRVKVLNVAGWSVASWVPKAKSLGRLPLSLSLLLFPFPLFSDNGEVPLWRSGRGGTGELVQSDGAASWSEEEVAEHREGPSWVRFFMKGRDFLCPSRSGWIGSPSGSVRRDIRRGVSPVGHDLITAQLAVAMRALCSVCRVASLVERCDTCLWLLSTWCWLVVSSCEVLMEFFSIGSGRSKISPELCCVRFWLLLQPFAVVLVRVSLRTVSRSSVPWWFWWRFSQDLLALLLQFCLLQCSL
ncbi:hypothetical protein Taro_037679, partial [Colocasia esculenta]|nr:hypothetical protein [Colocasia esculenta]